VGKRFDIPNDEDVKFFRRFGCLLILWFVYVTFKFVALWKNLSLHTDEEAGDKLARKMRHISAQVVD